MHSLEGEGTGQGGATEADSGTLHRADRGQGHPKALAPPGVQAPFGHQHPFAVDGLERNQPERLGRTQLDGQVGGQGSGAPIDRSIAAHHQLGKAEGGDGGGQRPGQAALVLGQFGHVAMAVSLITEGHADHGDT